MSLVTSQEELRNRLINRVKTRVERQGVISNMMDFTFVDCDYKNKTAEFSHMTQEAELNVMGSMHGGLVTWLLDTGMGCLASTFSGCTSPTITITVDFSKAIKKGDLVKIKSRLIRIGRSVIRAEAKLYVDDSICASALGSFYQVEEIEW